MLKGNLTVYLVAAILVVSAATAIQSYRLNLSKTKAQHLQTQIDTLKREKEYVDRLYSTAIEELTKARGSTEATRKQLQEVRRNDPTTDDWLNQPIPDGVRDLLR